MSCFNLLGVQYSVESSYCVVCHHVKTDNMSSVITHPKKDVDHPCGEPPKPKLLEMAP